MATPSCNLTAGMSSYTVPAGEALLTRDGGIGIFFVATPYEFKVGALIRLSSDTQPALEVRVVGVHPETNAVTITTPSGGLNVNLTSYLVIDNARAAMDCQLVSDSAMFVDIARQSAQLFADVTPPNPDPEVYLPVRLTNGASFYNATAGGSGGGTVDQGQAGTDPWPVTGPLTNAQLRASTIDVDASGSAVSVLNFPVVQGVSGTLSQGTPGSLAASWPIKVTNGTNVLGVNGDGSIDVVLPETASVAIAFNEVSSVASGVETTILSVTAPSGGLRITKVTASSDNVSTFTVKLQGNAIAVKRSGWTTPNVDFDFDTGLVLATGQTLAITGIHNRPTTATFSASAVTTS